MIASLRGQLLDKAADHVIVDVNGVGYEVMVSLTTLNELGAVGSETTLSIYTHVREDILQLIGFTSKDEKTLFLMLRGVSGIGTRTALNVLSGISPAEFVHTINQGTVSRLVAIPGIGKKTAERVIVDLRDKVKDWQFEALAESQSAQVSNNTLLRDLRSALINMGYKANRVDRVVEQLREDAEAGADLGVLLRQGLRELAG